MQEEGAYARLNLYRFYTHWVYSRFIDLIRMGWLVLTVTETDPNKTYIYEQENDGHMNPWIVNFNYAFLAFNVIDVIILWVVNGGWVKTAKEYVVMGQAGKMRYVQLLQTAVVTIICLDFGFMQVRHKCGTHQLRIASVAYSFILLGCVSLAETFTMFIYPNPPLPVFSTHPPSPPPPPPPPNYRSTLPLTRPGAPSSFDSSTAMLATHAGCAFRGLPPSAWPS